MVDGQLVRQKGVGGEHARLEGVGLVVTIWGLITYEYVLRVA
jgi:hypothetical protein